MSAHAWRWDGNWLVEDTDEPHGWEMVLYYTNADDGLHGADKDKALIAAAPDLLEALREVVSISDRKHNAWDKAHAAIAKAEGRQ